MKTIGKLLRELREHRGLLLREVSACISIDSTLLSKIERDERMATRDQVKLLAEFYSESKNEVIITWLSDKLVYFVQDEDFALQAIEVAEEKVLNYKVKEHLKDKESKFKT